jgi:hypothetical protein
MALIPLGNPQRGIDRDSFFPETPLRLIEGKRCDQALLA